MQMQKMQRIRTWIAGINVGIGALMLMVIVLVLPGFGEKLEHRQDVAFWNMAILAGHAEAVYADEAITYRWLPSVEKYEQEIIELRNQDTLRNAYVKKLETKALSLEAVVDRQEIIIERQKELIGQAPEEAVEGPVEAEPRAEVPVERILEDIEEVNEAEGVPEAEREERVDEPKKKWFQFWKSSGSRDKQRGRRR